MHSKVQKFSILREQTRFFSSVQRNVKFHFQKKDFLLKYRSRKLLGCSLETNKRLSWSLPFLYIKASSWFIIRRSASRSGREPDRRNIPIYFMTQRLIVLTAVCYYPLSAFLKFRLCLIFVNLLIDLFVILKVLKWKYCERGGNAWFESRRTNVSVE